MMEHCHYHLVQYSFNLKYLEIPYTVREVQFIRYLLCLCFRKFYYLKPYFHPRGAVIWVNLPNDFLLVLNLYTLDIDYLGLIYFKPFIFG